MDKLKIVDNENLVRDVQSQAVLNTDMTALEKYRAKRNRDNQISHSLDEVKTLKDEVAELKEMLTQLYQLVKEKNK
jgi:hypothetical protein